MPNKRAISFRTGPIEPESLNDGQIKGERIKLDYSISRSKRETADQARKCAAIRCRVSLEWTSSRQASGEQFSRHTNLEKKIEKQKMIFQSSQPT